MANPLGFHCEQLTPAAIALIQQSRPSVVVTLDLDPGRLAAIRPYAGMLVGRWDPDGDTQATYIGQGQRLGVAILQGIAPVVHLIDATVVLNEPDVRTSEAARRVGATISDAVNVLRGNGYRTVAGNFSAGTPALPTDPDGPAILDALLPGLTAADYYGGHEYSYPSMRAGAGYLIGRTSKILDYYAAKGAKLLAVLTETGIDFDGVTGGPSGYAANGISDDAYLADLQWSAMVWAGDPRILAAAIFEIGSYDRFASFDLLRTGLGARVAAWIQATQAQTPPQSRQDAPQRAEGVPVATIPVTAPTAIVAQDEGPSNLCWDVSVGECAIAAGGRSDVDAMYQAVKGVPYVAPGLPATFAELIHAVTWAAGYNGWQVEWYGTDGRVNDWASFTSVVGGGKYYVIAGIRGQSLNLGNFGHFEAVKGLYTAPDGTTMVTVADSYAAYDGAGWQPSYPLQAYLSAMEQNWDPDTDALAWRFTLPATVAPAVPAPVAAPAPATSGIPADEQAAFAYFTQTKIGIDRSHALWTACLLPLYRRAQQFKAVNDPLADLVMPGPLAGAETGTRWGGTRPASVVRLTNQTIGVYQDTAGVWHAYRPEQ